MRRWGRPRRRCRWRRRSCGSGLCRLQRMRCARRRSLRQGRDVMPYWPPDTPPTVPDQMPQAVTPGPAPVPYGGPGFAIAPDMLAAQADISLGYAPGADVLVGVTGMNHVTEAPLAAPNVNPYEAGGISAIYAGGDPHPGRPGAWGRAG